MSRVISLSFSVLLAAAAAAQTPALRKGVSVQMPVTTSASPMPDADLADSLVVAVTLRGTVFLEVTTVTPAELSEKVKAELAVHSAKRVYLKGDARTPYSTMAEVLDALRTAGVNAPILLTDQRDAADVSYVPPKGLEVMLPPPADAARYMIGSLSDTELRQRVRRDQPVLLQADGKMPFGDVVHAIDVCRAAGAQVFLGRPVQ